jgi:hexosaminidase
MNTKYHIIPKPVNLEPAAGTFEITPETTILSDEPNQESATYLGKLIAPPNGGSISIFQGSEPVRGSIHLKIDPGLENLSEEGYNLTVKTDSIIISASNPKGIFYGIQTLRQLLPFEIENRNPIPGFSWRVPCCQIIDKPDFPWRGYMLDEGRHFQGMETVLRTIELMALQKLNTFHWHLTEDQGWRIEIKGYPNLTKIGSRRVGTSVNLADMRKGAHNRIPHSGFYTQGEIRQIVAYAAQHNITIIPEIEIPGHSMAALTAYPELSCSGGPFQVGTRFGVFKDVYCPGKETTFEFLQHVLDEVMGLFPSKIIHIGGDEAPKARWKECPDCQQRIQDEGLKDVHDLQVYTTNRIGDYLSDHGRQLMGWNEILGSKLSKDAIVQYWIRNKKGLLRAIQWGQKVVNSAYLDTYLDHSYALTPLTRAYNFNPVFKELDAESAQHILGIEALMWTEWVPNRARLDYQTYPRLTAFAEAGWTPKNLKNYADFRDRLTTFNQRLDILGVGYAPEDAWDPSWIKRIFSIFTIAQPQNQVRNPER